MKCFYHSNDFDGHCSGAIVKYAYPECEMFPIDYGFPFPFKTIKEGETVFIVDFSLRPFEEMLRLSEQCKLIWIDHHKSIIEECYKSTVNKILGKREIGAAACRLTWEHLFPLISIPVGVVRIAQYDVWDLSHPDVLPFQYGCRLHLTDPVTEEGMTFWLKLFEDNDGAFYNRLVNDGKVCLEFQRRLNAKYCKNLRTINWLGYRCLVLNVPFGNSMIVEGMKGYDIFIPYYQRADGKWVVSLYTERNDLDVSHIAKSFGGGGHQKAAGFVVDELPDWLKGGQ